MKTKLGRALLAAIRNDIEERNRAMSNTKNIVPPPGPERIVPHRRGQWVALPDGVEYWPGRMFWFVLGFAAGLAAGWIALAFHEGWFTGRN